MEAQRVIDVLTASITRAERGLSVALDTQNGELAALNFRRLFHLHAQHGLVEWRMHSGRPGERLLTAVSVAEQAIELLPNLGLSPTDAFPLAPASGIATLVSPSSPLLGVLVQMDASDAEANLAFAVSGATEPSTFLGAIQLQKFPAQQALWHSTLQTYGELLSGGDPAALVPRAEAQFSSRAKDSYFSGGEAIYGGGPDNQLVLDFWLATILRRIGYSGPSPHIWVGA